MSIDFTSTFSPRSLLFSGRVAPPRNGEGGTGRRYIIREKPFLLVRGGEMKGEHKTPIFIREKPLLLVRGGEMKGEHKTPTFIREKPTPISQTRRNAGEHKTPIFSQAKQAIGFTA